MDIRPERIEQLLREVRTIQAYSTRVEKLLEELQGSVGTARKAQIRKMEKEEKLRMEIRMEFHGQYNKKS